ncbi:MAG: hypothetical protein E5W38_28845 [Mesorhizobium sp.]|nr:MAG: hypothetical protein E5W38_28845 [Mesorhizobium sp.]
MAGSKPGRSKVQRDFEEYEDYRLSAEVVERIRLGKEDILKAQDFWHGLDDLTYTEHTSLGAYSRK